MVNNRYSYGTYNCICYSLCSLLKLLAIENLFSFIMKNWVYLAVILTVAGKINSI